MDSPPGASLGLFFMLLGFLFLSLNVNGMGTSNRVELSDSDKQLGGGVGCMAFKKNDGCGREDGWKEGCCLSAMEKEIDNKQVKIQKGRKYQDAMVSHVDIRFSEEIEKEIRLELEVRRVEK